MKILFPMIFDIHMDITTLDYRLYINSAPSVISWTAAQNQEIIHTFNQQDRQHVIDFYTLHTITFYDLDPMETASCKKVFEKHFYEF